MSSQSAGRRRSNMRQYSAEDQALDVISKQAESRLAAKRAARAEAREIRLKEIEKQQKEAEAKQDRVSELSNEHNTAKNRQLTGSRSGSRRGSTESNESESKDVDFKVELRELEEKYKVAMMNSAQLDNEKQSLVYQVELLKDQLEEQDEGYTELQRQYKDKCRDFDFQKRDLQSVEHELSILKQQLEIKDRLIEESGFVIVANDRGEPILTKQTSGSSSPNGPLPSGAVLVSQETKEFLEKSDGGTLGTGLSSVLNSNIDVCDESTVEASKHNSDPGDSEEGSKEVNGNESKTKAFVDQAIDFPDSGIPANEQPATEAAVKYFSTESHGSEKLHDNFTFDVVPTNVTVTNEHGVSVVPVTDEELGGQSFSASNLPIKRSRSFRAESLGDSDEAEFYDAESVTPAHNDQSTFFHNVTEPENNETKEVSNKADVALTKEIGESEDAKCKEQMENETSFDKDVDHINLEGATVSETCMENQNDLPIKEEVEMKAMTESQTEETYEGTAMIESTVMTGIKNKEEETSVMVPNVENAESLNEESNAISGLKIVSKTEKDQGEDLDSQEGLEGTKTETPLEGEVDQENKKDCEMIKEFGGCSDYNLETRLELKTDIHENTEDEKKVEQETQAFDSSENDEVQPSQTNLVKTVVDDAEFRAGYVQEKDSENDEIVLPDNLRAERGSLNQNIEPCYSGELNSEVSYLGQKDVSEPRQEKHGEELDPQEKDQKSDDWKEKDIGDSTLQERDFLHVDEETGQQEDAEVEEFNPEVQEIDTNKVNASQENDSERDLKEQVPGKVQWTEKGEKDNRERSLDTSTECLGSVEMESGEDPEGVSGDEDPIISDSLCTSSSGLQDLNESEMEVDVLKDSGLASGCEWETKVDEPGNKSEVNIDLDAAVAVVSDEDNNKSQYDFGDIDEGLDVSINPCKSDNEPLKTDIDQNILPDSGATAGEKSAKAKKSKKSKKQEPKKEKAKKEGNKSQAKKTPEVAASGNTEVEAEGALSLIQSDSKDSLEPEDLEGALDTEIKKTDISKEHKKSKKMGFLKKVFK